MSEAFDPYRKWLGIPPSQQPPHHYRLLGIELYEADVEVIDTAAGQRMSYLQELAGGQYVKESQKLLNEVSAARRLLLDAKKKAEYDAELKAKLAPAAPPAPPKLLKPAKPLPKAAVSAEAEETITLNLGDAMAQAKKLASTSAGTKPSGKSSAVKDSERAERLGSNSGETARPIRRKKSSPAPALALLAVVAAGAVGAYVMRDKFAPSTEEEQPAQAITPSTDVRPSDDEFADLQFRLQKQEAERFQAEQDQANAKRTGVKFSTPKASASATGTAAMSALSESKFFVAPSATVSGTVAAAVAAPTATATATSSAVDAKAAAAKRGRVGTVLETNQEMVKENTSLFTPKEGLPTIAKPKPMATATPTGKPSVSVSATKGAPSPTASPTSSPAPTAPASPSATAAPTATPSSTLGVKP